MFALHQKAPVYSCVKNVGIGPVYTILKVRHVSALHNNKKVDICLVYTRIKKVDIYPILY